MASMAELPAHPGPPSPKAPRTFPLRAAIILLTLSLFGCDHATKIAAHSELSTGRVVPIVKDVLELRYTENHDTAFSLLYNLGIPRVSSWLFAASAIALGLVVAMWIASRKRASRTQHVAFALVLAGALGNVVDRAIRGYVIDFIHLTRWPVFNVADVSVVAGMILLMLCAIAQGRSRSGPRSGPGPDAQTPPAPS
jgi:signal peptidase II